MATKTSTALMLALLLGGLGTAQAQSCPCGGGTLLTSAAQVQALLSNAMVCASVGNEQWQEFHQGGTSGPVIDYKRGSDPVDPSEQVGTFLISDTAAGGSAGVQYTYGTNSYAYRVCQATGTVNFCGAALGGRDIIGARVATTGGPQSCATVASSTTRTQVRSPR